MHRNITGNVVRGDAIINPEDPMTKTQLFKHISEWGQYPYGAPRHSGNLEPNFYQIYPQGPVGGRRWNHPPQKTKTQLFKHITEWGQ